MIFNAFQIDFSSLINKICVINKYGGIMMSETENKTIEEVDEITSENVEEVMSKEEFARILFTDKRFRFVPNKKAIIKRIRTMNDEEYKNLIHEAFGKMKEKKK